MTNSLNLRPPQTLPISQSNGCGEWKDDTEEIDSGSSVEKNTVILVVGLNTILDAFLDGTGVNKVQKIFL